MTKTIKDDFLEYNNNDLKENLEYQLFESDHKRKENFKSHFARILIFFLYLASTIVGLMVFCWSYHFLSPNNWYFLSNERVHEIQNMLFAGLVSQAIPYISTYLKRQG